MPCAKVTVIMVYLSNRRMSNRISRMRQNRSARNNIRCQYIALAAFASHAHGWVSAGSVTGVSGCAAGAYMGVTMADTCGYLKNANLITAYQKMIDSSTPIMRIAHNTHVPLLLGGGVVAVVSGCGVGVEVSISKEKNDG